MKGRGRRDGATDRWERQKGSPMAVCVGGDGEDGEKEIAKTECSETQRTLGRKREGEGITAVL